MVTAVLPGQNAAASRWKAQPRTAVRAVGQGLRVTATPESMDYLVARLIAVQEYLGPAGLDALAMLERAGVADAGVAELADAAAAFWNVARYYSLPSLLIAAKATARLAAAGPTAVAAWSGVTAAELLAGGAAVAGQPPPRVPAPLPPGGFYLSAGEIPASLEVGAVRSGPAAGGIAGRTDRLPWPVPP